MHLTPGLIVVKFLKQISGQRIVLLIWISFYGSLLELSAQQTNDITPELNYPQSVFDSDTCCWRKLSSERHYAEAATHIVAYIKGHKKVSNKHSLHWHAGQMYAMAGDYASGKKYFKKTYSVFYRWIGDEDAGAWYYYAKGTVAFLDGDKEELEGIIRKWEKHFPKDINYEALLQLLKHWGERYALD